MVAVVAIVVVVAAARAFINVITADYDRYHQLLPRICAAVDADDAADAILV